MKKGAENNSSIEIKNESLSDKEINEALTASLIQEVDNLAMSFLEDEIEDFVIMKSVTDEENTNNYIEYINQKELSADTKEMAIKLAEMIQPISSSDEELSKITQGGVYAWDFNKQGLKKPIREINITFLGTGSMPYFGEHDVMSAGGDVLCQYALQKALQGHPSMVMKGLGTTKLDVGGVAVKDMPLDSGAESTFMERFYPLFSLIHNKTPYVGGTGGNLLGRGLETRLQIAMEEFFIPNLYKMIESQGDAINNLQEGEKLDVDINVVGHSRGAITSYFMMNLIDGWLNAMEEGKGPTFEEIGLFISHHSSDLDPQQDPEVLKEIGEKFVDGIKKIKCNVNYLGFDPVEGQFKMGGDNKTWATDGNVTNVDVNVMTQKHTTTSNEMPERVKKAQFFIAESERRAGFRPTIAKSQPNTEVSLKVKLGTHSTMTGNTGTDNGPTPDNKDGKYKSFRNDGFIQEAALAAIDDVRLDTSRAMFDENNLPPLQRHTLRRVFRDSKDDHYRYNGTRKFLLAQMNKVKESNREFDKYRGELIKKFEKKEITEDDALIKLSEWLMKNDPKLTQQVYFVLQKEIHDRYLCPTYDQEKELLSQWQQEMKEDSTVLRTGRLTGRPWGIPLQSESAERQVYFRHHSGYPISKIYNVFPEFKDSKKKRYPTVGGSGEHDGFVNPFQIHLSEILLYITQNYQEGPLDGSWEKFTEILELDMAFSKINEFIVKASQKVHGLDAVKAELAVQEFMLPEKDLKDFITKLNNAKNLTPKHKEEAIHQLITLIDMLPDSLRVSLNINSVLRSFEGSIEINDSMRKCFAEREKTANILAGEAKDTYIVKILSVIDPYIESFKGAWVLSANQGAVELQKQLKEMLEKKQVSLGLLTEIEEAIENFSGDNKEAAKPRSWLGVYIYRKSTSAQKVADKKQELQGEFEEMKRKLENRAIAETIFNREQPEVVKEERQEQRSGFKKR